MRDPREGNRGTRIRIPGLLATLSVNRRIRRVGGLARPEASCFHRFPGVSSRLVFAGNLGPEPVLQPPAACQFQHPCPRHLYWGSPGHPL